ncbi:MAG: hypothetical protein NT133_01170 [Alphaproteobacteria bacterium]|nr:hypothetical protein [Alphaproteobacteria bacterium]
MTHYTRDLLLLASVGDGSAQYPDTTGDGFGSPGSFILSGCRPSSIGSMTAGASRISETQAALIFAADGTAH